MAIATHEPQSVHAPRGTWLSCLGSRQEAAMRMLMNNVDPEIAEHPEQLSACGGGPGEPALAGAACRSVSLPPWRLPS
jgi:urocanate hydratase